MQLDIPASRSQSRRKGRAWQGCVRRRETARRCWSGRARRKAVREAQEALEVRRLWRTRRGTRDPGARDGVTGKGAAFAPMH